MNYTKPSYPESKYFHCHKTDDSILKDFYYNTDLDQYRPCYKACKNCSQDGDSLIHNCIVCKPGYRHKPFGEPKNNCVVDCKVYIRNAYEQYKCLNSYPCTDEAPYIIEEKGACIYDCSKDDEYKYLYNGKCVKTCPQGTDIVGNTCKVNENIAVVDIRTFYSKGEVTEEVGTLVDIYSKEFNYTNNYVSIHKNENYSIAIYKNMSALSILSLNVPLINFQNCYTKIQETYNITQDLIIAIVDRLDQSNPNTSYSIYHPISGEKLDAARICKDETISITENHFIDKDDPDYDIKMSLINQNINIFDQDDSFFVNICFYFDNVKKRDIALSDRVKYFYQKTNLCDSGCKQKSFNLSTQQAECDCRYNDIETEEKKNELIQGNKVLDIVGGEALDMINSSNLFIVKCYKYIFRNITKSFGAIISLILLVLNIGSTILFYVYELEQIKLYVYKLTENFLTYLKQIKNAPPKRKQKIHYKNNKKKEDFIDSVISANTNNIIIHEDNNYNSKNNEDKQLNSNDNKKINILIYNNEAKRSSKDNKKIFYENKGKNVANEKYFKREDKNYIDPSKTNEEFFKEYLSTSLDDLEFDDAIVKDKRKFCEYLCENFKENQNISYTFCAKDPIMVRSIKIVLFIFNLILNFVINALFISEDYISMLYHLESEDSFFSFVPRSISRFIKTTIVGEVIELIARFFLIEEAKIKSCFKRERNNKMALKQCIIDFIKELKKRYLALIIFVFVIILISFFYLLCFNYVYPYTQIEWIKTSIMVIIIRQLLSCLAILAESILRFLSFRYKSEKLFKISKILK